MQFREYSGSDESDGFDIFFKDLNKDAQKELLELFKTTEENENWDVFPLTTIYKENDNE